MVSRTKFIFALVIVALVAAFFGYQYSNELTKILDSIEIRRDSSLLDRLKESANEAQEALSGDMLSGDVLTGDILSGEIIDASQEIIEEITESSEQVIESVEEVVEDVVN